MKSQLPDFFRPLFWSYDFSALDLQRHKKTIMVNTVNFGNLNHWRWLQQRYGSDVIQDTLQNVPSTELRPPAKALAETLFHIALP